MRLTRGRAKGVPLPDPADGEAVVDEVEEALETAALPLVVLAAVNLLPGTYARRAAIRRARMFAVICLMIGAVIVGIGWGISHQRLSSAQANLDSVNAEKAQLQAQAARYADVPRLFASVASAQKQVEVAMGNEVRWSFFLNDLALTMPSGVSLDNLQLKAAAPGDSATTAPASQSAPAGSGASGAGVPGIGTMNVSARALSYNTVAKWLDSLAKVPTLSDPYVGAIASGSEEGSAIVTYTSTANITNEALSRRYLVGTPGAAATKTETTAANTAAETKP
jgi:Tfp pilus assembly protein PilN